MAVRLAGHALPVGIMPAWSYDKGDVRKLTLVFEPIAFVGLGNEVEGRMTRSNLVITRDSDDHDLSQQYFVRADGSGQVWLAVQYEISAQAMKLRSSKLCSPRPASNAASRCAGWRRGRGVGRAYTVRPSLDPIRRARWAARTRPS